MGKLQEYISRKKAEYGDNFDPSDLAPQFKPYFESGQRIEVETNGAVRRGYVGVTTGWKPAFLLIAKKNSHGSGIVLDAADTIIKSLPGMFR